MFIEQKELLCSQELTIMRNYRPHNGNYIVAYLWLKVWVSEFVVF